MKQSEQSEHATVYLLNEEGKQPTCRLVDDFYYRCMTIGCLIIMILLWIAYGCCLAGYLNADALFYLILFAILFTVFSIFLTIVGVISYYVNRNSHKIMSY